MSDNIKTVSCPNCGSVDVVASSDNLFICQACNSKFFVNVDENILNILKNIKNLNRNPEKAYNSGYRYNDSFTKDDFKNNVLLMIKNDYLSPSYIFDEMEMGDIIKLDIPITEVNGHSEINYSRSIGYDRTESWIETKTVKYSDGTRKVTNTPHSKTVTDWHPDSGMLVGEATVLNIRDKDLPFQNIISLDDRDNDNISTLDYDELDSIEFDSNIIESAKKRILNIVFNNNITYPGDHVANETYSGNTKILSTSAIVVSIYTVEIKIKDKELYYYACTNGNMNIKMAGDYPAQADIDEYFAFQRETGAKRRNELKKPKLIYTLSNVIGVSLFILLLVLGSIYNILALNIISFVMLIAGFIVGIKPMNDAKKIRKKYSKIVIDYNKERNERLQKEKNEGYERYIQNNK